MKEDVLDVLMYLFENYVDDDPPVAPDREVLAANLVAAGFARGEISRALAWLENLSPTRAGNTAPPPIGLGGLRSYHPAECRRLDVKCRGFLQAMESAGVLDAATRERVLERVMALEIEEISLEQLKWVTAMVLFHQPGQAYVHPLLEGLVFAQGQEHWH